MDILIVSQYFWPEEFRINDLALELIKRGHNVSVITGNPNYPKGKFFPNYGFKFSTEHHLGIKIYRVPLVPRGKSSSILLAINYLSFALFSIFFSFYHKEKYDKIFAVNYSPITSVLPAIVFKKRHKLELYLWVQDLWPESITAASKINSKFLYYCILNLVKYIYKNSDKILIQSEAFASSIIAKGVTSEKIRYLPNWAEDLFILKKEINKIKYSEVIPKGFCVMFAGNIGEAQDFESIVRAAILTKDYPQIKWVIVGDGRKKTWLEREILRQKLTDTFILIGRYPLNEMPNLFIHADIMLLSLKDESIFSLTIPGKAQSYMAFGKPIACMLNGIGAKVIKDADCGYISNAGDFNSLANNIIMAYEKETNILVKKGENGLNYYNKQFSKNVVIDKLLQILEEN